jgi:alpha-ketoglutarate-dependent 2,4-dichlorophenoxyacetate dioxygenase
MRLKERAMSILIVPANPDRPAFAGEVSGVDLRHPLDPAEVAAIEAGMDRFGVLAFHDQRIDDAQQIAFSRNFGPIEMATGDIAQGEARRLSMEINDISNLDREGQVMARDDRKRLFSLGNMLWHSDSSFKPTPAKYSLLSARIIPGSGGNTEFADMRAAWDALDAETRALVRDLVCEHSQIYSRGVLGFTDFTEAERARWTPVPQRLVRRHPRTGRLSLFLASHAGAIRGWPVPEARALLRDLTEHATQREFVHAHVWRPHDLVVWDNRVTMHRARRYDAAQIRDLHRTTVADSAPTLQQAA